MSSKQYPAKYRHYETQQKSGKKSQKMFEECQKVIKQLQSQLQYAMQQNQQKDKIIKLITEEKQFYEQQSKKSDEKIYAKLKEQINFNQALINGLKQHNKELTQKNALLQKQNRQLWEKCEQKDGILSITENNLMKLQSQKSKLQKQWGETLKCVKKKIFELQQDNNNFNQFTMEKEQNKKRPLSKNGDKKNGYLNDQKRKNSVNFSAKQRNEEKVSEVLKQIELKLLNYDFLEMIQSKDLKKEVQGSETFQSNKQNINENIIFNRYEKNLNASKKIPILKLSELAIQGQY